MFIWNWQQFTKKTFAKKFLCQIFIINAKSKIYYDNVIWVVHMSTLNVSTVNTVENMHGRIWRIVTMYYEFQRLWYILNTQQNFWIGF